MNSFKSILFALLPVALFTNCGGDTAYSVSKIENGNTILLKNGYKVILLGVSDTEEGEEYLRTNLTKKSVYLRFDTHGGRSLNKFPDKTAYAYVKSMRKSVNAEMLRRKLCELEEHSLLKDSLSKYKEYAGIAQSGQRDPEREKRDRRDIVPPTPISEPDDIDLTQWTYRDNGERNDLYLTNDCNWNCNVLTYVCDFNASVTRSFATQLAKKSPGEYNIGQVSEIYKYLRSRWKYVNDPRGREYLALASESIAGTKLSGDCDDFAIVMYSVITAIGGKARINFAWNSEDKSGHAYTEVFMNDFNEATLTKDLQKKFPDCDIDDIWYMEGNSGKWLNLDWTAEYPGGPYFKADERLKYFYDERQRSWVCE